MLTDLLELEAGGVGLRDQTRGVCFRKMIRVQCKGSPNPELDWVQRLLESVDNWDCSRWLTAGHHLHRENGEAQHASEPFLGDL